MNITDRHLDRLNLTNLIQQKLDHAPVPGVKLSALGWSSDVQDQLDKVTDVLFALFVLYAMSMGLTGLSMLGGLLAAACQPNPRPLVVANLGSASLGTLALAVASVVVSVVATRGVDTVNAKAGVMGVQAEPGWELLVLSWVAAAVALVVTLFWALRLVLQKRRAASEAAAAAAAAAAEEKGGEDKGE